MVNRKWAFFQPPGTIMTPAGCLHCNPRGDDYRADYAPEDWRTRGRFVHELVHAWQWQRGIPLAWVRWPFARYAYRVRPGRLFEDYGLEQQAEIVRHVYLQREGVHSPKWPSLEALTPILPFGPPSLQGGGRGWVPPCRKLRRVHARCRAPPTPSPSLRGRGVRTVDSMRLALFQPDIAANVGAALRLGACLATPVDIIAPCGFPASDASLKRAAMDYVAIADWTLYADWTAFRAAHPGRLVLLTTRAQTAHHDAAYAQGDILVLGRESAGAPDWLHEAAALSVRVPLAPHARSLNLVTAAALVLGEALRQTGGFP